MDIVGKVKSLGLPDGQFVVMGSAILELKGIRKAEDIDIIVTQELFDQLKTSAWHYKREPGDVGGGVDVEMLEQGDVTLYPYIFGGGTIDFFLNDPSRTEMVEGIRFASLSNLLEVKSSTWNRPKDREDTRLIREFLSKTAKTHTLDFREVNRDTFELVCDGGKAIETRAAVEKYTDIAVGDAINFVCGNASCAKEVVKVEKFPSIDAIFEQYKPQEINPTWQTEQDGRDAWASFPNYTEKIAKYGLIALTLKK